GGCAQKENDAKLLSAHRRGGYEMAFCAAGRVSVEDSPNRKPPGPLGELDGPPRLRAPRAATPPSQEGNPKSRLTQAAATGWDIRKSSHPFCFAPSTVAP